MSDNIYIEHLVEKYKLFLSSLHMDNVTTTNYYLNIIHFSWKIVFFYSKVGKVSNYDKNVGSHSKLMDT